MTSSVKVKLRRKENKQGLKGIVVQVIIDRKSSEYSTNQYVKEYLFDLKKQSVKTKHPRAAVINKAIHDKKREVEDIIFQLGQTKDHFSLKDVSNQILGVSRGIKKHSFCDFIDNYIKSNPDNWSYSTQVSYKSTLKKLKDYNPNQVCSNIDDDYVSGYNKYLIKEKLSDNSIKKELKNLKKLCNVLLKDEVITSNPFKNISVGEIKGDREYLNIDEIKSFKFVETLSENEKLVKDLFLFGIYTGFRFSDKLTLQPKHLNKLKDGSYRLSKYAKKKPGNGKRILLEFNLNRASQAILEKYNVTNKKLYCFPPLNKLVQDDATSIDKKISSSNAYFNTILKVLIKRAKITKKISIHSSRHTAATLAISRGADIYVLGSVLGHKKITSTQVYADIIDSRKDDLMKLMDELD